MAEGAEQRKERQWSPEEEVEFWLQLVDAWQEGAPDTWLHQFGEEGIRYLQFLCNDAFQKAFSAKSGSRLRALPSKREIWGEVLIWFAKSDRNFVTDIVYGGMEFAGRARGKEATIEDCLQEIRGRVYQRVTTGVYKDWLRKEVGTQKQVERELGGGKVSIDEQKENGARTLHETLSESGKEQLHQTVEGRELISLAEKIAADFFVNDLTERAERVATLFRLSAVRGSVSTLPKKVTEAICEVVEIKDFRRLSEKFNSLMRLLGDRIRNVDTTELSEEEAWSVGRIVTLQLEERCREWFFLESLNEGLFSWYETLTKEWKISE